LIRCSTFKYLAAIFVDCCFVMLFSSTITRGRCRQADYGTKNDSAFCPRPIRSVPIPALSRGCWKNAVQIFIVGIDSSPVGVGCGSVLPGAYNDSGMGLQTRADAILNKSAMSTPSYLPSNAAFRPRNLTVAGFLERFQRLCEEVLVGHPAHRHRSEIRVPNRTLPGSLAVCADSNVLRHRRAKR